MTATRRIGVLVLAEPQVFTQHSEYAAWWTKIEVPAGEYELTYSDTYYPWVGAALPGTIVDVANASHLGGVPVGDDDKSSVGRPATYHWGTYPFMVAAAVAEGDGHIRLDPDVRVEEGKPLSSGARTWSLVLP